MKPASFVIQPLRIAATPETVSAPGFQSATRNVTVVGVEREDDCHCHSVETTQVSVALVQS